MEGYVISIGRPWCDIELGLLGCQKVIIVYTPGTRSPSLHWKEVVSPTVKKWL